MDGFSPFYQIMNIEKKKIGKCTLSCNTRQLCYILLSIMNILKFNVTMVISAAINFKFCEF